MAWGNTAACALGDDGAVWCWGDDRLGQVGVGSTSEAVLAPTEPAW